MACSLMKIPMRQTLLQVSSFSICVVIAAKHAELEFVDFNGGAFTDSLLLSNSSGGRLFVVVTFLSLIHQRIAAIGGLIASFLCFPLYFFLVAPGVFRYLFPDAFWRHSQTNFYWDKWALSGILMLFANAYLCWRSWRHQR